jgi:hypothetical protein
MAKLEREWIYRGDQVQVDIFNWTLDVVCDCGAHNVLDHNSEYKILNDMTVTWMEIACDNCGKSIEIYIVDLFR